MVFIQLLNAQQECVEKSLNAFKPLEKIENEFSRLKVVFDDEIRKKHEENSDDSRSDIDDKKKKEKETDKSVVLNQSEIIFNPPPQSHRSNCFLSIFITKFV